MPISFKDKHGKKHRFDNHDAFVKWLKQNRPEIKDPDAFAAEIERRQRGDKKKEMTSINAFVKSKSVINGALFYSVNDKVVVKNVDIFLEGIDVPIVSLEPELIELGAEFEYVIDARSRAGKYNVVWNLEVDSKETKVMNPFFIGDDSVDRTLPLELQHLA